MKTRNPRTARPQCPRQRHRAPAHPRRRGRLDLRALARQLLSQGPAAQPGAGLRQPPAHRDRGQRHLLPHLQAGRLSPSGATRRPDGFVFSLKANRFATNRKLLATARRVDRALRRQRHRRAGRQARPAGVAVHADQALRAARFRGLPRAACRRASMAGRCAMCSTCATRVSSSPDYLPLARRYGCTTVHTDSRQVPRHRRRRRATSPTSG